MFMKQYNYKPRSGSQSSQGAAVEAPKDGKTASVAQQTTNSTLSQAAAGRRRSSASEKFAGLNAYKRSSEDHGDRKAALAEQKPGGGGGVLGGMWSSFTKGS